ncbi:MAG: hypothetical protein AAF529_02600 [Pseudomonadota bacterium]
MQLRNEIATDILPAADAAVAWLNTQQHAQFELTGLAEAPSGALSEGLDLGLGLELGLVLCDGEICTREQVRVRSAAGRFEFEHLAPAAAPATGASAVPALLDPPQGLRKKWLDTQLAKYEFILLLYYRGRW